MTKLVKDLSGIALVVMLLVGGVFGWVYSLAILLSSRKDMSGVLKASFRGSLIGVVALIYLGATYPDASSDMWLVIAPGFCASAWYLLGPELDKKLKAGIGLAIVVGVLAYMVTVV